MVKRAPSSRSSKKPARKPAAKKTSAKAKTTKSRAPKEQAPEEPQSSFGRQVFAVLLIAAALVLVVTWFSGAKTILGSINSGAQSLLGYAAYLLPLLLVFLAIKILRAKDNRIPPITWISSILMIIWIAGFCGVFSMESSTTTGVAAKAAQTATGDGGAIGSILNGVMASFAPPVACAIIYLVLMFITLLCILQMTPAVFFRTISNKLNKEDAKNSENADEDVDGNSVKFKINGAAPLSKLRKGAKNSPLKTATAKLATAPAPEHALVSVSDPNWKSPSTTLLDGHQSPQDGGNVQQNALIIKSTLSEFGIDVDMEGANIGPRVTQYTMRPPAGVQLTKILARDKELALNLAVDKIRIEAPIPGTRSVGVEIPNVRSADVRLRAILESPEWQNTTDPLTFAVGKDISGNAVVANLAKMPHLLVAGTTGSGKSVMTNTLIMSLLYRNSPSDLKLIIVDPKQVEMAQYEDIPHLLTPIITSTEKALSAMKWAVNEMERRYTCMAEEKVKKIEDYNKKIAKTGAVVKDEDGNDQRHDGGKMPYIVIIIDEMADLMMMAGKDLEALIVRIAQKGRAAGIHLVLATQRPEVKVITGLIKANVPGRIAFAVGSQVDSRIMLDHSGAEKLLGKGDMLMLTTEMMGKPRRIQGAFASDKDINLVTDFLRDQRAPDYNAEVVAQAVQIKGFGPAAGGAIGDLGRKYDPNDPIVRAAVQITIDAGEFATSALQRRLAKGHGFVAGLADWFEEIGVIGPPNGHKPRTVLISSMEEFDELANV